MNPNTARYLIGYGVFLIVMGVIGFLSNPEKAKTALISGGTFGSISIVWGVLGLRGVRWSWLAALLTISFLSVVFIWRSTASWKAVMDGNTDKRFAASLITAMLLGSIAMITILLKGRKTKEDPTSHLGLS